VVLWITKDLCPPGRAAGKMPLAGCPLGGAFRPKDLLQKFKVFWLYSSVTAHEVERSSLHGHEVNFVVLQGPEFHRDYL